MLDAIRKHWPEYLMEAAALGTFMVSATVFTVLLFHPASPLWIANDLARRAVMGLAMGLTAIGIIYSPWGKQSGAHMNPALTFTFYRLRKIAGWDAFFYVAFQFMGGLGGVFLAALFLTPYVRDQSVDFAVTVPGAGGAAVAFAAEFGISFGLMLVVLLLANSRRYGRWAGYVCGLLVALYILVESPLSGMSMNPARTVASALPAGKWTAVWIYFTAPPLAMLAAAELFVRTRGASQVLCAKWNHHNNKRCIFRCRMHEASGPA